MKIKFLVLTAFMGLSGISLAETISCYGSDDSNNSFSVSAIIDENLSSVEVYKNGNLAFKVMSNEECAAIVLRSRGQQTNINAVRMPHCDRGEQSSHYDLLQLVIEPGSRPDYNTRGVFHSVEDSQGTLLFLNCSFN